MLKYILVVFTAAFMFVSCASKGGNDGVDAMRNVVANANKACADQTLKATRAKLAEADKFKASGDADNATKAEQEALRIYQTEGPAYQALNDHNEAQNARIKSAVAKRDAAAPDAMKKDKKAWDKKVARINKNIANAQAAYAKCDNATAEIQITFVEQELDFVVIEAAPAPAAKNAVTYTVKKGDCLWNISGVQYKNPFMWPIIYWSNKKSIKDPDLIFPGQNFSIVFDYTDAEKEKAVNFAKNRGPWSLYDNK